MSMRFRAVLNLALLAIAGMATSAVPAFGLTRGSMPCKLASRAVRGLESQLHSSPDCVTTHRRTDRCPEGARDEDEKEAVDRQPRGRVDGDTDGYDGEHGGSNAPDQRRSAVELRHRRCAVPRRGSLGIRRQRGLRIGERWNVLGSSGFNVQDPAFPNLVDSSGNPTGAGFSIIGKISAYGLGNPADALLTDYFYWNTPGATSTSIDWSITGLTPSRPHFLFVNGANVPDGAFSMVVDEDASGISATTRRR